MTTLARITLTIALSAALGAAPAVWAQAPAAAPAAEGTFGDFDPSVEVEAPPSPAPYRHPDAMFYEVVENMRLVGGGSGPGGSLVPPLMQNSSTTTSPRRVAKAALAGGALAGTPFCPDADNCDLNAFGQDDIDLSTGLGRFSAKVSAVVQGDNPVDAPELVVAEYRVSGRMDLSRALPPPVGQNLPFGTVTGRITSTPGARPRFIGVFRLPFLATPAIRGALCPLTPKPNPYFPGWDVAYVDTTPTGELTGVCLDIHPWELSLGWPTVRFDIWFQ